MNIKHETLEAVAHAIHVSIGKQADDIDLALAALMAFVIHSTEHDWEVMCREVADGHYEMMGE